MDLIQGWLCGAAFVAGVLTTLDARSEAHPCQSHGCWKELIQHTMGPRFLSRASPPGTLEHAERSWTAAECAFESIRRAIGWCPVSTKTHTSNVLQRFTPPGGPGHAASALDERCQRRAKTAHLWRMKIAHFDGGDEPQCALASRFLICRDEELGRDEELDCSSALGWMACQRSVCSRIL